jgi:hypothetical protein
LGERRTNNKWSFIIEIFRPDPSPRIRVLACSGFSLLAIHACSGPAASARSHSGGPVPASIRIATATTIHANGFSRARAGFIANANGAAAGGDHSRADII